MTDADHVTSAQFEEHEKKDESRFLELGALVRTEVGKIVAAISGDTVTGGLRDKISSVEKSVPDNARERLRALEQLVPSDLPVVLSQLKGSEERRVIAMRLLWSSVAGLGVTVGGMIISKLLSHPGVTP